MTAPMPPLDADLSALFRAIAVAQRRLNAVEQAATKDGLPALLTIEAWASPTRHTQRTYLRLPLRVRHAATPALEQSAAALETIAATLTRALAKEAGRGHALILVLEAGVLLPQAAWEPRAYPPAGSVRWSSTRTMAATPEHLGGALRATLEPKDRLRQDRPAVAQPCAHPHPTASLAALVRALGARVDAANAAIAAYVALLEDLPNANEVRTIITLAQAWANGQACHSRANPTLPAVPEQIPGTAHARMAFHHARMAAIAASQPVQQAALDLVHALARAPLYQRTGLGPLLLLRTHDAHGTIQTQARLEAHPAPQTPAYTLMRPHDLSISSQNSADLEALLHAITHAQGCGEGPTWAVRPDPQSKPALVVARTPQAAAVLAAATQFNTLAHAPALSIAQECPDAEATAIQALLRHAP